MSLITKKQLSMALQTMRQLLSFKADKSALSTLSAKIQESTADWNQNDSNVDSYIKNRTHYEEIKSVTLVDNLTSEDYENGNAPACNFISGNTYDVIWNGVLYEGLVCIVDGEYNVIQASTGEELPFYIDDDGGNALYVETNGDVPNWTVSVVSKNSVVHKLDKKYLPDDIGGKPDWNENDPEASGYIKNRPFYVDEIVLFEDTVSFDNGSCMFPEGVFLVGGTEYTCTIDGQRFTGYLIYDDPDYYMPIDGGYVYSNSIYLFDGDWDITVPHTVKLSIGTLQKIDSIFLPDNLATIEEVNTAQVAAETAQVAAETAAADAFNAQATADENAAKLMTMETFQSTVSSSAGSCSYNTPVYANGKFVTTSALDMAPYNRIGAYSDDGRIWHETDLPGLVNANWHAPVYGNGKFVATAYGNASVFIYSEDGITWQKLNLPSLKHWNSPVYGNGKFVVTSDSSSAAYSEDGITWNSATLPSSKNWNASIYANGKFVVTSASASSTVAAYSEDGITWKLATLPSSTAWNIPVYGNGKFIVTSASTGSTVAAYSDDGITWDSATLPTLPSSAKWCTPVYGNGKFVVTSDSSSIVAYSEDGIIWHETVLPSSANWNPPVYGNGKFVATSDSSSAAYSEDGITWYETTLPSSGRWCTPVYGNGQFVAIITYGNPKIVAYSKDGITWKNEYDVLLQNNTNVTNDVKDIILEGYATEEYVDTKVTAPITASVGQVLVVKAVDENGKPTEWETVDGSVNTNGFELVDRTTGTRYNVYVDNGKLTLEAGE